MVQPSEGVRALKLVQLLLQLACQPHERSSPTRRPAPLIGDYLDGGGAKLWLIMSRWLIYCSISCDAKKSLDGPSRCLKMRGPNGRMDDEMCRKY